MQLKVVYLDDEPDLCEMFKESFGTESVHIETFTDHVKAMAAIQANTPDIFFIDFRLRGTTGDVVADRLQLQIPVVLLTGDLDYKGKYKFTQLLSKQPYPFAEIEGLLNQHLSNKKVG